MARNTFFHSPARKPLKTDPRLELVPQHTTGVFSFLNPTRAQLKPTVKQPLPLPVSSSSSQSQTPGLESTAPEAAAAAGASTSQQNTPSISYLWRSRDNRKGRHALLITQPTSTTTATTTPPGPSVSATAPATAPTPVLPTTPSATSHPRSILHILTLMASFYPYWDVSWLVGVIFTLGSAIWVVNAFFVWLPLVDAWSTFPGEISVGGGWTAFVGASVFEVGSLLLMLEAVNENRAACFGWALQRVVSDLEDGVGLEMDVWAVRPVVTCSHHHHAKRGSLVRKGRNATAGAESDGSSVTSKTAPAPAPDGRSWQWMPSWHDLTTHYLRELGFLACLFQLLGATIFWISGFTALPGIQALLPTQNALDGAYWVPQIIGGTGFVISSILFMLETQARWYMPAYNVLGWHIGLWNLIGALGFTLCGALGLAYASPAAQFQASLATFWGSWAFLIGSAVQWYESLDTHPVEVKKTVAVEVLVGDEKVGEKLV